MEWKSAQVVNSHLVCYCYHTIWQLDFDLPRQQWSLLTIFALSKLDYCNSVYHKLPNYHLTGSNRFKTLLLVLLLSLVNPPITPILKSLHWLKVNERIIYKLLSLTYKVLTTTQPSYLHIISLQPPHITLLICCHPFSPTNHLLENH